ncbi:hypothetical protein V8E36_001195 [Tilletia maclaganii]
MGGPATALVIGSTSFLLGTLALHWSADHLLLWQSPITPTSLYRSFTYYSNSLLPVLDSPGHGPVLYAAGLLGSTVTLLKALGGRESNWLFDGASLFLYGSVGIVYYNNILINLRTLPTSWPGAIPADPPTTPPVPIPGSDRIFLALREIASSNAIIAVALVGVILLQSAQYYSERLEERERIEEVDAKIRRRIRKRDLIAKEAERVRKAAEASTAAGGSSAGDGGAASSSSAAAAGSGNGSASQAARTS